MPARRSRRLVLIVLLDALLPNRLRNLVAALWILGGAIAGLSTWLALSKLGALAALPYAVAMAGLVVLALATRRGLPWALAASLFLLGLQLLGVVGSAIELWLGEAASKTSTLRSLDVDPTLGILANLAYSAAASGLFGWAVIAFVVGRQRRRPGAPIRAGAAVFRGTVSQKEMQEVSRMAQVIDSDVKTLRASFSATVMAPGDAGYEEARSIWNGSIGRRPGLIARYSSPAEEVPSGSRVQAPRSCDGDGNRALIQTAAVADVERGGPRLKEAYMADSAGGGFVRPPGQGRSIDLGNFAMSVKATEEQTRGQFSLLEATEPPGFGPPLHIHRHCSESFYVLEGEYTFFLDDCQFTCPGGSFVFIPPGMPHSFRVSAGPGRKLVLFTPAAMVGYFDDLSTAIHEGRTDEEALAAIAAKYSVEVVGPVPEGYM